MAGDFVGDGSLVNQAQTGTVGVNVPDTIDEMPRTFVTEHEERWSGGRKLHVIKPIVAAMNDVRFPGGDIEGEEQVREFGVVDRFEPIRTGLAARNLGCALAESACEEGFVGVDGQTAPAARKLGDLFCDACVEMRRIDDGISHVKELAAFGRDDFAAVGSGVG